MSMQNDTLTTKIDDFVSKMIYGIGTQLVLFYTCNIWLTYLPIPSLFFMHYTYLFSLYLAYKLPLLAQGQESESLDIILKHLQKQIQQYTYFLQFGNIQYLFLLVALYHMPALIGILMTYIILSQNYGHQQTDVLFHFPLILLCSLFAMNAEFLYIFPPALLITPLIFTLMFANDASLLSPKALYQAFQEAKANFKSQLHYSNPTQKIILCLILGSLLTPILQFTPMIWHLYPILTSPVVNMIKFSFITFLIGDHTKQFLSPMIKTDSFDHLFSYTKENAMPTVFAYFNTTSTEPNSEPQESENTSQATASAV